MAKETVRTVLPIGMINQLKPVIESVGAEKPGFSDVATELLHKARHRPLDTTSEMPKLDIELPRAFVVALAQRPEVTVIAKAGAFSPYTNVAKKLKQVTLTA
ncbi:MAG: hypothetical protein KBA75_08055 [Alphaproteobacteria bacterium]|nr:hypothetical protein [Alphaproteobacteria bacterium]